LAGMTNKKKRESDDYNILEPNIGTLILEVLTPHCLISTAVT